MWGEDGKLDNLRLKLNNYEVCHIHKGELNIRGDFHTPLGEGVQVTDPEKAAVKEDFRRNVEQGSNGQLCSDDQFE